MRVLLFLCYLLALCSFSLVADDTDKIQVSYRNASGEHQVIGQKTDNNTFAFNLGASKHLKLATLDWSPYIGKNICKQGWVFQVTVALLHHLDYSATITFYPWARALNLVESGRADILFPEYFIDTDAPSDVFSGTKRLDHLSLSDAFGWGPVAFIKRESYDLSHYNGLSSLVNEHIGVVRGYQNTPEFDHMMDMGSFKIIQAKNDLHNLKLLINKRVNLIVGDPMVIKAEVQNSDETTAQKKAMLGSIKVVRPLLDMNGLYYAISRQHAKADELKSELNKAIKDFKSKGVFSSIKYRVAQACELGISWG